MFRRQRRRQRSRGQSLVEFSLVFPIFILLLAGIIDFGLGMYSYMTIQNATREGARLAVTNCDLQRDCTLAIQSRTAGSSNGLLDGSEVTVACFPKGSATAYPGGGAGCANSRPEDSVRVSTSYTYRMIWPLTFGTQIPMTSTVTFMLE